jgi:hypothetical protein
MNPSDSIRLLLAVQPTTIVEESVDVKSQDDFHNKTN